MAALLATERAFFPGLVVVFAALAAIPPPAAAESGWTIRIGASRSRLEGALGDTYSRSNFGGTIGLSWRADTSPWRLRTGLQSVTRSGVGRVPVFGLVADSTLSGGVIGSIDEGWHTLWLEAPLMIERAIGRGRLRPYGGAGLAPAWRVPERSRISHEVPPGRAHRLDASALASAGLAFAHSRGTARVELAFAHGLRSLYDSRPGPQARGAPGRSRWT